MKITKFIRILFAKKHDKETDTYKIFKAKKVNEVVEHSNSYEQVDDNRFYTNWSCDDRNLLFKSCIEEVTDYVYGTNVVYATYLTEDNEEKAFGLIAGKCQEDMVELQKKLDEQANMYISICTGDTEIL